MSEMMILKLGGSLITNKSKRFSIRRDILRRVSREIGQAWRANIGRLVIVHGGGSFGHPVAKKYALQDGFKRKEQIPGVAHTRRAMSVLSSAVIDSLLAQGLPALTVQPSANVVCRSGRIKDINLQLIEGYLKLGLIPVLHGDVVLDEKMGFCILSGDQLVYYLSRHLKPEKAVLTVDVDGVFDKDPKRHRDAKLLPILSRGDLVGIDLGRGGDATGGMRGKLLELLSLASEGVPSQIINASKSGRLRKALSGEGVIGTWVEVEHDRE